jgi:hypothetical protein
MGGVKNGEVFGLTLTLSFRRGRRNSNYGVKRIFL